MWKNLEKALGAQADQEEREYLHRNSNDSAQNNTSYLQEFQRARLSSDFEPAQIGAKEENKEKESFAKINVIQGNPGGGKKNRKGKRKGGQV